MILSLRRRHRRVFIALGAFLPAVFAIGIATRKPAPVFGAFPAAPAAVAQSFEAVGPQRSDLFAKIPVQVRLWREQIGANRFAVGLSTGQNFVKPDLIVYWDAGNPAITDTVPDNAILLGGFGPSALLLPEQAAKSGGVLVLYSLADGEIVDVSHSFPPATFNVSTH
jgi:hypothetical protein